MCKCIEQIQQELIGKHVTMRGKTVQVTDAVFNEAGIAQANEKYCFATYSTVEVWHGSKKATISKAHSYCPYCGVMNEYGVEKLAEYLKQEQAK